MDTTKWKLGYPFDLPSSPEEVEFYIGWVSGRLHKIIMEENHVLKYKDMCQVLSILKKSASNVDVDIDFLYNRDTKQIKIHPLPDTTKEDILNLPLVAKEFGRLYRFKAREFDDCNRKEELNGRNTKTN